MLYGCDGNWWKAREGVPEFEGLKLSQDTEACTRYRDVHHIRLIDKVAGDILTDEAGLIGSGGNSGFQALNLAVQFGAQKIALVGFDLRVAQGVHWHGKHARGLNNPCERNMIKWRRVFNEAAITLAELGIAVINVSTVSTVSAFRFGTLDDILEARVERISERSVRRRNARVREIGNESCAVR